MTDEHDHAPRPYSTLRDGKIVWVTPEEHAGGNLKRSRLESDDEVRRRIKASIQWSYWNPCPDLAAVKGKELDKRLTIFVLPPRQFIDE